MLSECIYKVLMASGVVTSSDACDLSGAIEAAVLEAQGKQEPWPFNADRVTYHKAAPVVQPDMVMVPREPTEAMLNSCWRDYPEAARETWRAMIAAAEGKG